MIANLAQPGIPAAIGTRKTTVDLLLNKTAMLTRLFTLLFLQFSFSMPGWSNGVVIINGTTGTYLELKESDIQVNVNSQIAVVTSRQVFYNQTGAKIPIRYAFPLSSNANAIELKWYINGQWHQATISKSTQNDSIPGNSGEPLNSNLLEFIGETPLMFSPLDSISPDSSVTFVLKYVELLPYAFGVVEFYYPNDYHLIQGNQIVEFQHLTFRLNSERTIENIESVNHTAAIEMSANEALVTAELFEVPASADYEVRYQLSSTELGVLSLSTYLPDSLLHCDESGQGFLSLIIEPESNAHTEVIEKNFSLIIDRSGSMSGEKIQQAKEAAAFIVNELKLGDFFNIIDFSTSITSLYPELVPYNLTSKGEALEYIGHIGASGSTNISGALTSSILQFSTLDSTKANIIIFLTDGMATAGITNTQGILEAVRTAVNGVETEIFLFTFGIGNDVDRKLLTQLALDNNGIVSFLENDELQEKISSFFLTINNPVLLKPQFEFIPPVVTDIYPLPMPNLYKGQQLILSGRYKEPGVVNLLLSGKAFNLPVNYLFPLHLSDTNDIGKSFLPKIWAKQAIDKLGIDYNLADSENEQDSIQAQIDSLSICYGVVSTRFTSFEDHGDITEVDEYPVSTLYGVSIQPNPFRYDFTISITSPSPLSGPVRIILLDAAGQQLVDFIEMLNGVETLIHCLHFRDLPPNIYYCLIVIGEEVIIRKVVKV